MQKLLYEIKKVLLILVLVSFCYACTVVQPYEKTYLNDPDMKMTSYSSDKVLIKAQSYREGSSGANGGSSGGGCGCN